MYTKGEWKHKEDGVIMADSYQIACVMPKDREGNAHLISAAPDMYEVLKKVKAWYLDEDDPTIAKLTKHSLLTLVNEAINKAEGK